MIHFHTDRVFSICDFLLPSECTELIRLAENQGFESATVRTQSGPQSLPTIRNNQRTVVSESPWTQTLWERLSRHVIPTFESGRSMPVGLPKDLRFYKYEPGERFKMHKDGPWLENGLTSRLTFLVYLNAGFEGGHTDFRDFKIHPETGKALLFFHDTWHEGCAVQSGIKYVLRSDVLYSN